MQISKKKISLASREKLGWSAWKSLLIKALKRRVRRARSLYQDDGCASKSPYRGVQAACTLTPAIISEANSLYRAMRRPNRILDNAIIRTVYKLDACTPTTASLQAALAAAYGT